MKTLQKFRTLGGFADVLIEDSDLYRFNADASERLGIPITRVCDGRTPFELFRDRRFLGNARIAPCSRALKQLPCRRWLDDHFDPANTVLYVGLEPSELRRAPGIVADWKPWSVEFPLLHHTSATKYDLLAWCRASGLTPPRLYRLGFPHNNCVACASEEGKHTGTAHCASSPTAFSGTTSRSNGSEPNTATSRSSNVSTAAGLHHFPCSNYARKPAWPEFIPARWSTKATSPAVCGS